MLKENPELVSERTIELLREVGNSQHEQLRDHGGLIEDPIKVAERRIQRKEEKEGIESSELLQFPLPL